MTRATKIRTRARIDLYGLVTQARGTVRTSHDDKPAHFAWQGSGGGRREWDEFSSQCDPYRSGLYSSFFEGFFFCFNFYLDVHKNV